MTEEDKLIENLFKKVEAKKLLIEKLKRPEYRTNQMFSYTEDTREVVNLNTIGNVAGFVKILAHLLTQEQAHKKACEKLVVHGVPFKWQNHSMADWFHDIKIKVANLNIKNEKQELQRLEDKLNRLVSPEMKRKLELEAIAKELDG